MRCNTCGDYIARGKKFNARKETVENEVYLGLKIFRFYFKCPVCMQEITYKTDPVNFDYIVENGATPNFKALKLAQQQAIQEQKEKEEEEKLNPMKLLENRTKASRREMENLEALEDLKEINQRGAELDVFNDKWHQQKREEEFQNEMKRIEEEEEQILLELQKNHASTSSHRAVGGDLDEIIEECEDEEEQVPLEAITKVNKDTKPDSSKFSFEAPTATSKRKTDLKNLVIVKKAKTMETETKPLTSLCSYSSSDSDGD